LQSHIMAAILCRLCFVEPCKALSKCCEGCCSCMADSCECFARCCGKSCSAFNDCCDFITSFCDKPFSGCLFSAVTINAVAMVFGIVAITSGGDQCDNPLLVLSIVLLVCAVINALFGVYTYNTINNDADNPLFGDPDMKPSQKLYQFVKYDYWMAAYILFVVALIVLLCVTVGMATSCHTSYGRAVEALCIVLFVYLGIGMLICMGYVAVDAFKEWASECMCWLFPCMWPCLLIGCCLSRTDEMEKDWRHKQIKTNSPAQSDLESGPNAYPQHNAQAQRPQPAAAQPIVVVHQPPPQQQQVRPQPVIHQQYHQPQPQYQQQPYVAPQAAQPAPYNPAAAPAVQPGVLVVNPAALQQNQQNQGLVAQPGDEMKVGDPGHEPRNSKDLKQVALEKGKEAAAATGKHAKKAGVAAMGWMAKKMNELNDKVQDDKVAQSAEQQEGVGNQNTR